MEGFVDEFVVDWSFGDVFYLEIDLVDVDVGVV